MVIFVVARNTKKGKDIDDVLRYINADRKQINACYKKCKEIFKDVRLQPKDIIDKVSLKMGLSAYITKAAYSTV